MSDDLLALTNADIQDFADILTGVTVIGLYNRESDHDDDADRLLDLRERLIIQNPGLAAALADALEAGEAVVVGTDTAETIEGLREILAAAGGDDDE